MEKFGVLIVTRVAGLLIWILLAPLLALLWMSNMAQCWYRAAELRLLYDGDTARRAKDEWRDR